MLISTLFLKFILYSLMGWIWESIYCTLSERKWQNRGFLFGPVCPIYGVGATVVSLLFTYVPVLDKGRVDVWKLFLICAAGSAVLEYTTSFLLEVIFHAKWWDYSNIPLNVNGRICLPATTGFGVAGIFVIRYVFPPIDHLGSLIVPWLAEISALLLMAVFAADIALTLASLTQLLQQLTAYEAEFNTIMAENYQKFDDQQEKLRTKLTEYAARMTYTQRQALKKIKAFSLPSRESAVAAIKGVLSNVRLPRIVNTVRSKGNREISETGRDEKRAENNQNKME